MNERNLHPAPGSSANRTLETPLEARLRAEANTLRVPARRELVDHVLAALEREPPVAPAAPDAPTTDRGRMPRRAFALARGAGWLAAAAAVLAIFGTRDLWLDAPPPPAPTLSADSFPGSDWVAEVAFRREGLGIERLAGAVPPTAAATEAGLRTRVEDPLRTELQNLRTDGRRAFTLVLGGLPDPLGRLFSGS